MTGTARVNDPILVYGATGYTAGLVIERLVRAGSRPKLSARDPVRLRAAAERFGLPYQAASLDDPTSLCRALSGAQVLLNLAGPFVHTALPAATACVELGVHYLDVAGEVDSILALRSLHEAARKAGVMLLPGVGFDVVPSDCLCAHVARRLGDVHALRVAIAGLELVSPGSLRTLVNELGRSTRVVADGQLREIAPGSRVRTFDFGSGGRAAVAVTWGDLATAPITTGASHVETYFEQTPAVAATVQLNRQFAWFYGLPWVHDALARFAPRLSRGPSSEQMASRRATIVVEAEDREGRRAASRLTTPEAYSLTAETARVITAQVLSGDHEPGFQTPGRLFGPDFILRFDGVTRWDEEASIGH